MSRATKTTSPLSIADVVDIAVSWHKNKSNNCFHTQYEQEDGSHAIAFSEQELIAYDQRIYEALDFLVSNETLSGRQVAACLKRSMRHWSIPYFACSAVSHRGPVGYVHAFQKLRPPRGTGTILVNAWCFNIAATASGLEVVSDQCLTVFELPEQWMAQHFPGSLHRVMVASSLGLSISEVVQAACCIDSVVNSTDFLLPAELLIP